MSGGYFTLVGKNYGRLTVIAEGGRHGAHRLWTCSCACGNTTEVLGYNLKKGNTTSCGCFRREIASSTAKVRFLRHGDATRKQATPPEYRAWVDMKQRCENPANRFYIHYGARGISICERWSEYTTFLADMGQRPSAKHSLDRIDVNGNYEPANCRWATPEVQRHNIRARSATGHKNIGWNEQRQRFVWAVSRANRKLRGRCRTLEEAIAARDAATQELYGESA